MARASARSSRGEIRGTQSFVGTLSSTWKRPSLTAFEVAWRWAFGIPALLLLEGQLRKVLGAATGGTYDPAALGLDAALLRDPIGALTADPMGAAGKLASAVGAILPGLAHVALWLAPLLLGGWIVVSSLGRTLVLRRIDSTLHPRPFTLMQLSAMRMLVLLGVFALWFAAVTGAARIAITSPIAAGQEPNLVLYCAIVIVSSLGLFTAWAFVGWVLAVAPLLAMLHNLPAFASLRAAVRLGPLQGKLVEINLVLGIVKIALLVLAMVFSATPLPFQSVTSAGFLAVWWAGVTLVYLLWSDFFHVARLVGYLQLWRTYHLQQR